jgi:hypothetical protein
VASQAGGRPVPAGIREVSHPNVGLAWLVASVALAVAGLAALLGAFMAWIDG